MAFNVSALSSYVEQHRSELMSALVIAFKSSSLFSLMPDVKGPTTLNLISAPVTFQSGASCGFNPSGDVSFTQRTLTPGTVKVNEEFCPKALLGYYNQHEVMIGAGREEMPFEEKIMSLLIANIGKEMETAFWQGDATNGTGNNAFFDGLNTILTADVTNSVISASNVLTAGASDTILDRMKALVEAVPDNLGNKMKFYMSSSNYRKLAMLLTYANLYHYERNIDNNDLRMVFPGSDIEVIGVAGLAGIDKIWGMNPDEVVYGFDKQDDVEAFDLWYSKDNDTFRFKAQWNAGVQYAFPTSIIAGMPYSA